MNKAKRPCDINPSTKIGCTNIQVYNNRSCYVSFPVLYGRGKQFRS